MVLSYMVSHLDVLVTGGAGFIGHEIVFSLLRNGVGSVTVLDNLSTGNIDKINALVDTYDNIKFVHGDITNVDDVRSAMGGCNAVCHQAADVSVTRSVQDQIGRAHV